MLKSEEKYLLLNYLTKSNLEKKEIKNFNKHSIYIQIPKALHVNLLPYLVICTSNYRPFKHIFTVLY